MALNYPLTIDQATDFAAQINISSIGLPLNLSDYTAKSQVRKSYESSSVVFEFTTLINVAASTLTLSLTPGKTTNSQHGLYVYDVYMKNEAANLQFRIIEGPLTLKGRVTRY